MERVFQFSFHHSHFRFQQLKNYKKTVIEHFSGMEGLAMSSSLVLQYHDYGFTSKGKLEQLSPHTEVKEKNCSSLIQAKMSHLCKEGVSLQEVPFPLIHPSFGDTMVSALGFCVRHHRFDP